MGDYLISQLAERTGFPASTLRYYEQSGLLPEAARTSGGYRSYDDETVERLRFVARAKQLGLPLAEIRELAAVWEDGSCAPVQDRLGAALTAQIAEVEGRVGALTALRDQLAGTLAGLGRHTPEGPCDDDCGCLGPSALPVACTLTEPERRTRGADWADLLAAATDRQTTADGVRLTFPADAGLAARVAALAVQEQECCQFFAFTVELAAGGLTLRVRAPAEAADTVSALFGVRP